MRKNWEKELGQGAAEENWERVGEGGGWRKVKGRIFPYLHHADFLKLKKQKTHVPRGSSNLGSASQTTSSISLSHWSNNYYGYINIYISRFARFQAFCTPLSTEVFGQWGWLHKWVPKMSRGRYWPLLAKLS